MIALCYPITLFKFQLIAADFLIKSSLVIIPDNLPLSVTNMCEIFKKVNKNWTLRAGKLMSTVSADLSAAKVLSSKSSF